MLQQQDANLLFSLIELMPIFYFSQDSQNYRPPDRGITTICCHKLIIDISYKEIAADVSAAMVLLKANQVEYSVIVLPD